MFSRKQKFFIVSMVFIILSVMWVFLQASIWFFGAEKPVEAKYQPAITYQITHQDTHYYTAIEVVQTEDGTYVPNSYYGYKDNVLMFTNHQIKGALPTVKGLVSVRFNENGQHPIVKVK